MRKLTRLSSLQETKSLASHPLRKNPQRMFGQQENENEREGKTQSKALYILYIYISIYIGGLHDSLRTSSRELYKENYKTKYLRLFTPFPNLITKESYNWWVTRRKWRFRYQKNLKKNISQCRSQLSGSFKRTPMHCAKWLRNSRSKRLISQRCAKFFLQLGVIGFQWL